MKSKYPTDTLNPKVEQKANERDIWRDKWLEIKSGVLKLYGSLYGNNLSIYSYLLILLKFI